MTQCEYYSAVLILIVVVASDFACAEGDMGRDGEAFYMKGVRQTFNPFYNETTLTVLTSQLMH